MSEAADLNSDPNFERMLLRNWSRSGWRFRATSCFFRPVMPRE